jgi:hypothetical protein
MSALKYTFVLTLVCGLLGCAAPVPLSTLSATRLPPVELCRIALIEGGPGNTLQVANAEVRNRQLNCHQYLSVIQAQISEEDARRRAGMAQLAQQMQQTANDLNRSRYAQPAPVYPAYTTCNRIGSSTYCTTR